LDTIRGSEITLTSDDLQDIQDSLPALADIHPELIDVSEL
jgi:dihydroxyacid dehydratase/phosphogluconate dehydratase